MFVDFSLQGGLQHLPRPLADDHFQRTHRLGRCFDSSLGGILAHGRSPLGEFCLATKPYREETSVFYSVHKNRSYLGVSFEEVMAEIATGRFLGPEDYPNHPGQKRIIVRLRDYPH